MTPAVAHEVLDVLDSPGTFLRWEKELNVYLIDVDLERSEVRVEDDLDTSEDGVLLLSLEEMQMLLRNYLEAGRSS